MATAILHIGTPKTASTSLQAFFHMNRALLADAGISFPIMPLQTPRTGEPINGSCLIELSTRKERQKMLMPILLRKPLRDSYFLLRDLGRNGSTVLLSEENLFAPIIDWRGIAKVLRRCGFDDARAVVYLRSQDAMLSSMWRQACEGGYSLEMTDSVQHYCFQSAKKGWAGYATRLEKVEDALGRGCVVVRRFNRNRFVGGDIYRDFCNAVGIPWNDAFTIPDDRNLSVSCDIAMAMRELTMAGLPQINTGHAGRLLLMELAEELSQRFPDEPGAFPMTYEDRRELCDHCAEENRLISERYFGGEPFGDEPPADYPVWEPDEERTRAMVGALYDALAERLGRPGRDGQASAAELVALADSV